MGEETIHVVRQHLHFLGAVTSEEAVANLVRDKGDIKAAAIVDRMTLYRSDLRPIYGGPTLLEALWAEMDRLMEGLMTGSDAEDGGDKYRAAELAWVLAIVSNPYNPSVDAIRAETMERWKAQQEHAREADEDVAAEARSERESLQFEAAGVNGYEL